MLREQVLELIDQVKIVPRPVQIHSHFFADLAFDSLSFIAFLLRLEGIYSISFDIADMEECLQVGRLIEILELKVKERREYE